MAKQEISSLGVEVLLPITTDIALQEMLGFGILRMWTIPGPRQKFGAGQNNNVAPNDAREGVTVLLTTPFANNIRFEVLSDPV
jgi:hypothetical protein